VLEIWQIVLYNRGVRVSYAKGFMEDGASMKDEIISDSKRGYLQGDFHFFHLKDQKNMQFEFHYHDFNKILIFIEGRVTYLIEGKAYNLKPWDIIFVSNNEVHKPIIDADVTYERIVIWSNSEFLDKHSSADCDLSNCFKLASDNNFNLLRLDPQSMNRTKRILNQLEISCKSSEFGSRILSNSLFMQLCVFLNREFLGTRMEDEQSGIEYDENVGKIINYINENLEGALTIEALSTKFFMSRYYLMHRFKKQTGYSVHNYVTQKRLILAASMLKNGVLASDVCAQCGFGDYSSFVRSFKKVFGVSPKQHYKNALRIQLTNYNNNHF